jgi:hypothetical protein
MFNLNLFNKKQSAPEEVEQTLYDAEIDLSKFDIAVIERVPGELYTTITYEENDRLQQYDLYCTPEKHQELVDDFRLQLMDRK